MKSADNRDFVLLTQDWVIGYLATTYTPLRSWLSHYWNTPEGDLRRSELEALFKDERFLISWSTIPLLIVFSSRMGAEEQKDRFSWSAMPLAPPIISPGRSISEHEPTWLADRGAVKVFQNSTFVVFRTNATAGTSG